MVIEVGKTYLNTKEGYNCPVVVQDAARSGRYGWEYPVMEVYLHRPYIYWVTRNDLAEISEMEVLAWATK